MCSRRRHKKSIQLQNMMAPFSIHLLNNEIQMFIPFTIKKAKQFRPNYNKLKESKDKTELSQLSNQDCRFGLSTCSRCFLQADIQVVTCTIQSICGTSAQFTLALPNKSSMLITTLALALSCSDHQRAPPLALLSHNWRLVTQVRLSTWIPLPIRTPHTWVALCSRDNWLQIMFAQLKTLPTAARMTSNSRQSTT